MRGESRRFLAGEEGVYDTRDDPRIDRVRFSHDSFTGKGGRSKRRRREEPNSDLVYENGVVHRTFDQIPGPNPTYESKRLAARRGGGESKSSQPKKTGVDKQTSSRRRPDISMHVGKKRADARRSRRERRNMSLEDNQQNA